MAGYSLRNLIVMGLLLGAAAWQYFTTPPQTPGSPSQTQTQTPVPPRPAAAQTSLSQSQQTKAVQQIRAAAADPDARFWTTVSGTVLKNLKDDQEGSRHQKFLLELAPDVTLLVSHNIDLAPRVPVQVGDRATLRGEYAWNNRGGVLHWTHHDPKGRRDGGWIELRGQRYE